MKVHAVWALPNRQTRGSDPVDGKFRQFCTKDSMWAVSLIGPPLGSFKGTSNVNLYEALHNGILENPPSQSDIFAIHTVLFLKTH